MCGIASLFNPSNAVYLKFALIGVVLGSVGTWFVGQWLNQKRPRVKLARWMEERRKELCSLVDQGQFQLAPVFRFPPARRRATRRWSRRCSRRPRKFSRR